MSRRNRRRTRRDLHIRRRTAPGTSPGVLVPHPEAQQSTIEVIAYGPEAYFRKQITQVDSLKELLSNYRVVWVNVDGLGDVTLLEQLGELFGFHRLALEDAVNTHQRAKVEIYGPIAFIVARMADPVARSSTEQLSMFLGKNFVVTIQEETGDCWDPVRDRIRQSAGKIRHCGPDYLAYALLDAVIDAYFPLLEQIGDELDDLEVEAIQGNPHVMERMHKLHSELLLLRRAIRPHREALGMLARDSTPLVSEQAKLFFRDCYDHVIQINDLSDTYREFTTDLRDLHLSAMAMRTNETMRVLTVIATLFMPLSFIAGVYGMNFDSMPELHWRWGYAWALSLMAATAATMLTLFARRGWVKTPPAP